MLWRNFKYKKVHAKACTFLYLKCLKYSRYFYNVLFPFNLKATHNASMNLRNFKLNRYSLYDSLQMGDCTSLYKCTDLRSVILYATIEMTGIPKALIK